MSLLHFLPFEHLVGMVFECTIAQPREDILDEQIPQVPLVHHISRAQRAPLEPDTLAQECRNIDLLRENCSAQQSQQDDPPVPRNDVQVPLEVRCARVVNHKIHAFSSVQGRDLLRPVGRRGGVDRGVAVQGIRAERALRLRAGRGVDLWRRGVCAFCVWGEEFVKVS